MERADAAAGVRTTAATGATPPARLPQITAGGKYKREKAVQNRVRRTLGGAVSAISLATALIVNATGAYATTPKTLKYQDRDGLGQIIISEFASDPATGGQRIHVQLRQ